MKKLRTILVAAAVGAAVLTTTTAANAPQTLPVRVDTNKDDDGVVGVFTGTPSQPLVSAWWNTRSGAVCAGFSYQIPVCIVDN